MAKDTKTLGEAFAVKDELEGFLANLEKLKADGSITEEQYTTTRKEYYRRLGAATSEIARIKNELKEQLEANQHDLETHRQELASLEVKHKVGELSPEQYQASERKLQAKIDRLERDGEELTRLIQAASIAAIGAPVKKPVVPTAETGVPAKKPAAAAPELPPSAKAAPPVKVAAPGKGIKLPRGRLLAMIGGAVVVIVAVVLVVVLLAPGGKDGAGLPPEEYETIDIPVNIEGAASVGSLHFELVYDWGMLRAVEVENGTVVGDAMFEYSVDAPGRVIVGLVSSQGISGDGSVAVVTFQTRGEADMGIPLYLENIVAHDAASMSEIPATASAGSYSTGGDSIAPVLLFTSAASQ